MAAVYETAFDSRPLGPPVEPDTDALLEASRRLCGTPNKVCVDTKSPDPAKEEDKSKTFSPSVEFKKLEVGSPNVKDEPSPTKNYKLEKTHQPEKPIKKLFSSRESCSTSSDSIESVFEPKRRKSDPKHFKDDMKRPSGEPNADSTVPMRGHLWLDLNRAPKRQRRHLCLDDLVTEGPIENILKQEWYHGSISRGEAESLLRLMKKGSFLVRCSHKTSRQQYLLSLKSTLGVVHVKLIEHPRDGTFSIEGPERFESVPRLIQHFRNHVLCTHGMSVYLTYPVMQKLL